MEKFDITVIGAGAVGLAVSKEVGKRFKNVCLLETHPSFGRETSSRNSEVIHAGIYYEPGSLKGRLCVEGKALLYEFLTGHDIEHRRTGKLIIGNSDEDGEKIEALMRKGLANGLSDLSMMSEGEIASIEPRVKARFALYSPSTGIFDTHGYMKTLLRLSESGGVICAFDSRVSGIGKTQGGYAIRITSHNGEETEIESDIVINSCGLHACDLASASGMKPGGDLRISYIKGEYFSVTGIPPNYMRVLAYPPPRELGLGIHTVLDTQGRLKLGPNAFQVESIEYSVDPSHADEFYGAVKGFLPFLKREQLSPDTSGIRPRLTSSSGEYPDFYILEESASGFPGFINLLGIESPGLTASLAIANYVASLI